MLNKSLSLFMFCFLLANAMLAQTKTVTGTVTAQDDGLPVPGANVLVKGSTDGTATDFDGKYTIEVADDAVLVFSAMGFATQEISVVGKETMDVKLASDSQKLDEVVVTALGVKREAKALTYASQTIGSDEVTQGKNMNFAQGLTGKVAGVEIRQGTAGAGSSTKIQLRGSKNITSSNQPLFVIDGIPMANYQTSDANGFYGGRDSGDGLSNINPDDIASVTVLRGANAAALYGSQGANGVILIETKQGKEGRTRVTVSSTTQFQQVYDYPDLQFSYGQTEPGSDSSWGERGNYNNFVDNFFDTGVTLQNSVSLSGGNSKTTTYFSYANSYQTGTMPTNEFNKNNLTFKQTSKFFDDKLKVASNVMLTDQKVDNKTLNGYYFNPLLGLYTFPRGANFNDYANQYQVLDPVRNIMTQNWAIMGNSEGNMNPYWILNNAANVERTKRFIGNASLEYTISDAMKLAGRASYDYTRQIYEQKVMAGSSPVVSSDNGRYVYSNLESWQAYTDLILTYDKDFGEDWDFHGLVGGAYQKRIIGDGLSVDSNTYGLYAPNIFTIQNMIGLQSFSNSQQIASRMVKQSVFANASLGYKDMLFLDVAARNDWASTLAFTDNSSYLYPSVGVTFLPSEAFTMPEFISYAKVRASFAQVANEVPAFMTNPINSSAYSQINFNNAQPFTELKPEIQDNWEFGADFKFFNSRVNLSATYYQIDSKDQFLPLSAILGTVWQTYYVNAGHVRNYGVEVTLGADVIRNDDFSWNTTFNFTHSDNEIIKLADQLSGQRNSIVGGGGEGYEMYIVEGGSLGDIYVNAYTRDDNGNIVVGEDGVPINANSPEGMKMVGSANPDFMLGWNNTLTYKNWNLSFLIDSRFGGKFVSQTEAYLDALGATSATAAARDNGGVQVDGVLLDGTPYSGVVDAQSYYTGVAGRNGIKERYVYDATNIRLRQLSLGYRFNFNSESFVKDLNVSLVGNNLFFFYNEAPTDPDFAISTGNGSQAVENFGPPISRNFGLNLTVNF